jgi:hypothetical protein
MQVRLTLRDLSATAFMACSDEHVGTRRTLEVAH